MWHRLEACGFQSPAQSAPSLTRAGPACGGALSRSSVGISAILDPNVRCGKQNLASPVRYAASALRQGTEEGRFIKGDDMSFLAWIVLGLIAGFIASKIVNRQGEGILWDVILGVVGAIAGGYIFDLFGAAGVTGLNLYSTMVAVVGAIVVLLVYHAIRRAV
jgi:uncharacterized membrane protein YeaQ/YmgE (transglycosylase-associated protein family)